jgi:hypothetical protein
VWKFLGGVYQCRLGSFDVLQTVPVLETLANRYISKPTTKKEDWMGFGVSIVDRREGTASVGPIWRTRPQNTAMAAMEGMDKICGISSYCR